MTSPEGEPAESQGQPGAQPPPWQQQGDQTYGPQAGAGQAPGGPSNPGPGYDPRYPYGWPGYDPNYQAYQGDPAYAQGYPGYPGSPYPTQYPWPYDPNAPYGRAPNGEPYSDKQKLVAGLLQIFLGGFGAGRWYLGDTGIALGQLFTCGGLGIWALIDGIMILTGNVRDKYGRPLRD
jgi:hypothetical protein